MMERPLYRCFLLNLAQCLPPTLLVLFLVQITIPHFLLPSVSRMSWWSYEPLFLFLLYLLSSADIRRRFCGVFAWDLMRRVA